MASPRDTLEKALDFFATSAIPTDGFKSDSSFRLVMCVGTSDWAATAAKFLQSADFSAIEQHTKSERVFVAVPPI